MSLDISISRNGTTLAEINWLRNPFGLCQWAEDNVIVPDTPHDLYYVCNHWAYSQSLEIDRELFGRVVLDYWQQVQAIERGYFWFTPLQYKQLVMPYAKLLPSRDSIHKTETHTEIPMEYFSNNAFRLGPNCTLQGYKDWFAKLVHIAALLQEPDVEFYCSN